MEVYDHIAELYQQAKQHPWRRHIEAFTLFELLGDLNGRSVLDLACGEGHYTRQLRQRGAGRVVGVDISSRMIELARAQESRQPLGVTCHVSDVAALELGERFDVVTAVYLFDYATNQAELDALTAAVSRHLKPGGRLVAVDTNGELRLEGYGYGRRYGVVISADEPLAPFSLQTIFLLGESQAVHFPNHHLPRTTLEVALVTAGFQEVRWPALRLSPEAAQQRDYWRTFLDWPAVAFVEAVK